MFCRHFVFRCVYMKTVDFLEKLSSLVMCNSRFLMLCFTKKKKINWKWQKNEIA